MRKGNREQTRRWGACGSAAELMDDGVRRQGQRCTLLCPPVDGSRSVLVGALEVHNRVRVGIERQHKLVLVNRKLQTFGERWQGEEEVAGTGQGDCAPAADRRGSRLAAQHADMPFQAASQATTHTWLAARSMGAKGPISMRPSDTGAVQP